MQKERDELGAPRFSIVTDAGEKMTPELTPKGVFDGAHGLLFALYGPDQNYGRLPKYYFVSDSEYEDDRSSAAFDNIFKKPDEQAGKSFYTHLRKMFVLPAFVMIPLVILSDILGICLCAFTAPGEYPVLLGIDFLAIVAVSCLSVFYSNQSRQTDRERIRICCITIVVAVIEIVDFAVMLITRRFCVLLVLGFVIGLIGHLLVIFLLTKANRLLRSAFQSGNFYIAPAIVLEALNQWVHGRSMPRAYYKYYIRAASSEKVFLIPSTKAENRKLKEGTKGDLVCIRNKDATKTFFFIAPEKT